MSNKTHHFFKGWSTIIPVVLTLFFFPAVQKAEPQDSRIPLDMGTLSTQGQPETVDFMLRQLIDNYIPTNRAHSAILIFTECFGGDQVDDFEGRCSTTVLSATSSGEQATYNKYDLYISEQLKPGPQTAFEIHMGYKKDLNDEEYETKSHWIPPGTLGASLEETTKTGNIRSRHILFYAGKPETKDDIYLANLIKNFGGGFNTTITTAAGKGKEEKNQKYDYPGTLEGLRQALAEIREKMNPNEQFILFVTDHGGIQKVVTEVTAQPGETLIDTIELDSYLRGLMDGTLENNDSTGISVFIKGEVTVKPGDITISVDGQEYQLFTPYRIDLNGDGILTADDNEGYQLFFKVDEDKLTGDVPPGQPYRPNIVITNNKNTAIEFRYITVKCGTIPKLRNPVPVNVGPMALHFGATPSVYQPPCQAFTVSPEGNDPLYWEISDDACWLSCYPASGNSTETVTVSVDAGELSPGDYTGTVTVNAPAASNSPRTVTVNLKMYEPGASSGPFGQYLTPETGSTVSSSVPFTGWALDDVGIDSVGLYRKDGGSMVYIGDAVLVEGARPDIETSYPDYPNNYKAGWGYMMLTNFLPGNGNGTFIIEAIASDFDGNSASLGTKTITVDNQNAVKPFGAIDSPAQGGTASGSTFVNGGWVLTPYPKTIPTDGSTIDVWVDGINMGHPAYDIYREDILDFFPGYSNSHGAGAYFYLDTTAFHNGTHTIYWTAVDDEGTADGIGSRYFTILDSGNTRGTADGAQGTENKRPFPGVLVKHPGPVDVSKGYKRETRHLRHYPDNNGNITVEARELERIEIDFSTGGTGVSLVSGYMVVGNSIRPLPVGSTLDAERGLFYWQPGPGFAGVYRFVFTFSENGTIRKRKDMTVAIMPRF